MGKINKLNFQQFSKVEIDDIFKALLQELEMENNVIEINKKIAENFGGYQLHTTCFDRFDYKLFRVTKNYDGLKELLNTPKAFFNPPSEKTQMGRANIEKHPVFYASNNPNTAMEESKVEPGQEYYISNWEFQNNTQIRCFLFTYDSKDRNGFLENELDKSMNQMLVSLNPEEINNFKYKQKRVLDLFTHESSKYYNISSAIAHNCLYLIKESIVETPILIYPSVKKTEGEYNFAIHPSYIQNEENFKLNTVLHCRMDDTGKKQIIISKGIYKNDVVEWGKLKINFLNAEIEQFQYYDFELKEQIIIDTKNCAIVSNNEEIFLFDYLDDFVKNNLSKYVENEMTIDMKLFNIFDSNKTYQIEEIFECPLTNLVIIKENGKTLNSVKFKVNYQIILEK